MSKLIKEAVMQPTNIKDGKRVEVLHGENRIIPVDEIKGFAADAKPVETNTYIAGHSETGHHHVLESKKPIKVFEPVVGNRAFLLEELGKLFHQKTHDIHETQYLAPGAYKIVHKTEYDPFSKVVRNIWD